MLETSKDLLAKLKKKGTGEGERKKVVAFSVGFSLDLLNKRVSPGFNNTSFLAILLEPGELGETRFQLKTNNEIESSPRYERSLFYNSIRWIRWKVFG